GEVSRDYRGQLTYTETQADGGRVTMQTRSICNVGTLTAIAPATTAPATTAPATTGPSLAEQLAAKQAEQEAEQRRKQAEQEAEQRRRQAALEGEQNSQRG